MAVRGRKPGFKMPEEHRSKIRSSVILSKLEGFVLGKEGCEMPPHAVTAALGLLRKVLPDLASVEHQVQQVQPFAVLPNEIKDIAAWEAEADPDTKH